MLKWFKPRPCTTSIARREKASSSRHPQQSFKTLSYPTEKTDTSSCSESSKYYCLRGGGWSKSCWYLTRTPALMLIDGWYAPVVGGETMQGLCWYLAWYLPVIPYGCSPLQLGCKKSVKVIWWGEEVSIFHIFLQISEGKYAIYSCWWYGENIYFAALITAGFWITSPGGSNQRAADLIRSSAFITF